MEYFETIDWVTWVKADVAERITEKAPDSRIQRIAKKFGFNPSRFSKIARRIRPYNLRKDRFETFQEALTELVKSIK